MRFQGVENSDFWTWELITNLVMTEAEQRANGYCCDFVLANLKYESNKLFRNIARQSDPTRIINVLTFVDLWDGSRRSTVFLLLFDWKMMGTMSVLGGCLVTTEDSGLAANGPIGLLAAGAVESLAV